MSFSFSRAAQPEARGLSFLLSAGFLYHILSPMSLVSKLTDFLSSKSYIIVQHPLLLVGVTIALIQPIHSQGYNILIDRMHLLFTKVHFLFWQPGRVVGQYTTLSLSLSLCRSSRQHPVSAQNCWKSLDQPQVCPCVVVHKITSHEFALTSPAVPCMSGSSFKKCKYDIMLSLKVSFFFIRSSSEQCY